MFLDYRKVLVCWIFPWTWMNWGNCVTHLNCMPLTCWPHPWASAFPRGLSSLVPSSPDSSSPSPSPFSILGAFIHWDLVIGSCWASLLSNSSAASTVVYYLVTILFSGPGTVQSAGIWARCVQTLSPQVNFGDSLPHSVDSLAHIIIIVHL